MSARPTDSSTRGWGDFACMAVALTIALIVRGYFLAQPMRFDEAFTFLKFVNGGMLDLFAYTFPNNHILHTLLVKLSASVSGAHPVGLRMPAFLAGIGSVWLTFMLCRALRPSGGLFAPMAMAVWPYMILYSTMARGYTLLVLLTLALALTAARFTESSSLLRCATISLIAALGMMTIPTMAFPIVGLYLWLVAVLLIKGRPMKSVLREFVVPSAVMTSGFTVILYTPTLFVSGGFEPILENRFVSPLPWHDFVRRIDGHLGQTLSDFTRNDLGIALYTVVPLVAVGLIASAKWRDWLSLLLLPSLFIGSAAVFVLKHAIPYPRIWIFLLPFVFITADLGLTFILELFPLRLRQLVPLPILLALGMVAASVISNGSILEYPDTGLFAEGPRVVEFLEPLMRSGDEVRAKVPADAPIAFYLWYHSLPEDTEGDVFHLKVDFFVVKKSVYSIGDLTKEPVRLLLDLKDAAVYQTLTDGAE